MALRETILQTSHELFYQYGFHDSGVELLAKRAGTTKRTLYAHFGNKEGLIEAVLHYRHQDFMAQLNAFFDDFDVKNGVDVAVCYLTFLKNWTSSKGFYGCMFINACAEFSDSQSSPHQIAKRHKAEVRARLLKSFERVDASKTQDKSDTLFVWGEGVIVAAQTGQKVLEPAPSFFDIFA